MKVSILATITMISNLKNGMELLPWTGLLKKLQKFISPWIYFGFKPGKKVIITGGGLVGCEAALHLAKTGHEVTIIEALGRLAGDSYGMYREALMTEMDKAGIKSLTNTRCVEVSKRSARVSANNDEFTLEADTVMYALGMEPLDTQALEKAAGDIPVYIIGDCSKPAQVGTAMKSGYDAACGI